MASGSKAPLSLWQRIVRDIIACTIPAVLVAAAPVGQFDVDYVARVLGWMGPGGAPNSVIVAYLSSKNVAAGDCTHRLESLRKPGARPLLVLPPVDDLCPAPQGHPWKVLEPGSMRWHHGRVTGFTSSSVDVLHFLGAAAASWVLPYPFESVPSVELSDLDSGRISAKVLEGRIVLVALEDPVPNDSGAGPRAAEVAAALAGLLEHEHPTVLARTWLTALVLLVTVGWLAISRLRLTLRARRIAKGVVIAAVVAPCLGGFLGVAPVLPLPSLLLGIGSFFAVVTAPALLAARRARAASRALLDRPAQTGTELASMLPDQVFWNRLTSRIAAAHPCDGALIGELPPYSWWLTIHPNGDLTEAVIRERRRDIRRWPYSDEHGAREPRVLGNYVVTNVPTLLVPLEAAGEIEGFAILIGKSAEESYLKRPEQTRELAQELALMMRRRRLERQRDAVWDNPLGALTLPAPTDSRQLLDRARAVVGQLELFSDFVGEAPVGLMYADPFGDVRLMSRAFVSALAEAGVDLPTPVAGEMLKSGNLALARLVQDVAAVAGIKAPYLDELAENDLRVDVPLPPSAGRQRSLVFRLSRLKSSQQGGFVGSAVESQRTPTRSEEAVERLPESRDPLAVFSLSQVVVDVVETVTRRTHGKVGLQSPRVAAHVLGHRREITEALQAFLIDLVGHQAKHEGPTIVLKERQNRVELTIVDLRLGVPTAALRRTLLAPSEPPPGLDPLAALARAIENSHGSLQLRDDDGGWGSRLTANLLRAKPRLEPTPLAPVVALHQVDTTPKKQ